MNILDSHPVYLTYCMNVHPAGTLRDIEKNIVTCAASVFSKVGEKTGQEKPYGLGLWFPNSSLKELAEDVSIQDFKRKLEDCGFYTFTLNGFPYAGFHNTRVKEQVYSPDWSTHERFEYTKDLALILTKLLPEGIDGTISTVPVTFKPWADEAVIESAVTHIVDIAAFCDLTMQDTGKCIRLALEPEPGCFLEKTDDLVLFFLNRLHTQGVKYLETEYSLSSSRAHDIIRTHVGACIDTVHSAVMFENPLKSIAKLNEHDIRIYKMHLGAAVRLDVKEPGDTELLEKFADEVYLHQVMVREDTGKTHFFYDLPQALESPVPGEWRVHFHVPLSGNYSSVPYTAVSDVDKDLLTEGVKAGVTHFEVETYTLNVLPGFTSTVEQAMANELVWVMERFKK